MIEEKEPSNGQTWTALRKAYNLTQAEMSEITKIPKRSIENWENNKRKAPAYMLGLVKCKLKEWDNAKKFGK